MDLILPQPYHPDPGRSLTPEEREAVTVTPIEQITSKTCKRERDNDKYRLGRR